MSATGQSRRCCDICFNRPNCPSRAESRRVAAAIECLILVAEKNGPTMMARIGMMKALNRHVVREFNPDRKDSNWGKRKLKRDQDRGGQAAPIATASTSRAIVSRGHGQVPNASIGRTIDVDDDHLQVGWCGPTQPIGRRRLGPLCCRRASGALRFV